jgi:UDP-GlcNAc:undecaprenyl-phosphate/decaprenyl-phosphate GlcNAc-1-phosphate transferase
MGEDFMWLTNIELFKGFLIFIFAIVVSGLLFPKLIDLGFKIGLVDYPNARKVHRSPTPRIGGVGVIITSATGILFLFPEAEVLSVLASALILGVIGVYDDLCGVNHVWKFLAQIISGILVIVFGGVCLDSLGDVFGIGAISLWYLSVPVTIFSIMGVINALNMIDGLDGLLATNSMVIFGALGFLSYLNGNYPTLMLTILICGSLLVFLYYNWSPAKIFMGDAGSLFLGFLAACISIKITQGEHSVIPPIASLCVLALPIIDTVSVMLRRLFKKKSPFYPDKTHIHHILLNIGFTKKQTVLLIVLLSLFCSLVGICAALFAVSESMLFLCFVGFSVFYLFFSVYADKTRESVK